jgi:hypothetical protein
MGGLLTRVQPYVASEKSAVEAGLLLLRVFIQCL